MASISLDVALGGDVVQDPTHVIFIISPYRFLSTDGSIKNKSSGTLFFVFDHITVPMYRMYVLCTRKRCNISLIEM